MKQKGFTLIELLVVIALISLLASVVLESLSSARSTSQLKAEQEFQAIVNHSTGDQLVGQWTFDNDSVGAVTTRDSSGFNYTGAVNNATYLPSGGYNGSGAYSFDGSTSYIDIPGSGASSSNFNTTSAVTVSAWVKTSNTTLQQAMIVSKMLWGPYYSYNLETSFGVLQANVWGVDETWHGVGGKNIADNVYHYLVFTYDGNFLKLYIDGVLSGTSSYVGAIKSTTADVVIGARLAPSGSLFFNGIIDDVRVYAKAFGVAEIKKLYAQGAAAHSKLALK